MEPVKSRADESAGSILVLPSLLDLTAAETLCRSFLERLSAFDSIVIEGAEVDRVSTAAIQVLLAAAEDARSRGISFQLNEPSEALADALSDLGLPVFLAL